MLKIDKIYQERKGVFDDKKMKLIDIITAVRLILWLEFIFACCCILLSRVLPFEVCFYLLCGCITALNGIGAFCVELKMKKEENDVRHKEVAK